MWAASEQGRAQTRVPVFPRRQEPARPFTLRIFLLKPTCTSHNAYQQAACRPGGELLQSVGPKCLLHSKSAGSIVLPEVSRGSVAIGSSPCRHKLSIQRSVARDQGTHSFLGFPRSDHQGKSGKRGPLRNWMKKAGSWAVHALVRNPGRPFGNQGGENETWSVTLRHFPFGVFKGGSYGYPLRETESRNPVFDNSPAFTLTKHPWAGS